MWKRESTLKFLAGTLAVTSLALAGCGRTPVNVPESADLAAAGSGASYAAPSNATSAATGSYGTTAGASGVATSPYGATTSAYGAAGTYAAGSAYGTAAGAYGGAAPQLQAQLTVKTKGFLFFTHAKVEIVVTNPAPMPQTGTLTVTWTDDGSATSSVQTQQVALPANGSQTIDLIAPTLKADGATCTITASGAQTAAAGYGAPTGTYAAPGAAYGSAAGAAY